MGKQEHGISSLTAVSTILSEYFVWVAEEWLFNLQISCAVTHFLKKCVLMCF